MTLSEQSNIQVGADLSVGGAEPLDVLVRVEPGGRCAALVLTTAAGAEWRLTFGPDGTAFIAGLLAAHAGVRFG